jgi:hypothetical protein
MGRLCRCFSAVLIMVTVAGCSRITGEGGSGKNAVNINSIDMDSSTNYKYLFREEIKKEQMKKSLNGEVNFK